MSKCFHLWAGARRHLSAQGEDAKGLLDSPFPLEDEMWLGERVGEGERRNNSPQCEICWNRIPGSHLTRDLSLSLGGLPPRKQRLISSFHALCISSSPRLLLLNHCKMRKLWAVSKWANYFQGDYVLPYETCSRIRFVLIWWFEVVFPSVYIINLLWIPYKEPWLGSSF